MDAARGSRRIRVWQCGQRYQQKGMAGCKGCNLFEKDLEQAFLTAWNGIVENREGFLPAWEKQIKEGDALEKWRAVLCRPMLSVKIHLWGTAITGRRSVFRCKRRGDCPSDYG